jgi:hypothetical protein
MQNISLFLYINIEVNFGVWESLWRTATLQRAAKRAQSQACLGFAERQRGSTSVNAAIEQNDARIFGAAEKNRKKLGKNS